MHIHILWLFLQIGGRLRWCPCNKSTANLGSLIGPLIFGISQINQLSCSLLWHHPDSPTRVYSRKAESLKPSRTQPFSGKPVCKSGLQRINQPLGLTNDLKQVLSRHCRDPGRCDLQISSLREQNQQPPSTRKNTPHSAKDGRQAPP